MNPNQAQQDVLVYIHTDQFDLAYEHFFDKNTAIQDVSSLMSLKNNIDNDAENTTSENNRNDLHELQPKLQKILSYICLGEEPNSVSTDTAEYHLPIYIFTPNKEGIRGALLFQLSTNTNEPFSLIVIDPTVSEWKSRTPRLNSVKLKVFNNLKQAYYYLNEVAYNSVQFRQIDNNYSNGVRLWYYRDQSNLTRSLSDLIADEVIVSASTHPFIAGKNSHMHNPEVPQLTKPFDFRRAFLENQGCPLEFQSSQLGEWKLLIVAYLNLLKHFYTTYSNISSAMQMIDFTQTIQYLNCLKLIPSTADRHWRYSTFLNQSAQDSALPTFQHYPISFPLPRSWMQEFQNRSTETETDAAAVAMDSSGSNDADKQLLYERSDFKRFEQELF